MAKDIFNDDYFNKHRDTKKWSGLKKKSVVDVLNVKNKQKYMKKEEPKSEPAQVKVAPEVKAKPSKIQPIPEDMDIKIKPAKQKKQKAAKNSRPTYANNGWKDDYTKSVLTGLYGAFIAIIIFSSNLLQYSVTSKEFWMQAVTILIGVLVLTIVFGFVFRAASAE
jgi:hypothetical protein